MIRRRVLDWGPELALVLVTAAAGIWAAGRWIDPASDPGIWWSTVFRITRGELLYRDIYLQFGPLSPYLLAAGARLFGATSLYFLVATWVPAILAGVLLLRAASPLLNFAERFALAGLLISESLIAPGPARLVFPYAPAAVHALLLSAAAFLLGLPANRPSRPFLAGVLAGLAFCSKQEVGLACAAALAAGHLLSGRPGFARAARSGAGFAVAALAGAAAVFGSAPMESLRENSHLWPLAFSPPERWTHLYRWVAGVSILRWEDPVYRWAWIGLAALVLGSVASLLAGRETRPLRWLPTAALAAGLWFFWPAEGIFANERFRPTALAASVAALAAIGALSLPAIPGRPMAFGVSLFAALVGTRAVFSVERAGPYSGIAHFAEAFTWVLFLCLLAPRVLPGGEKAPAWVRRFWALVLLLVSAFGVAGGAASLREPSKETVATLQGRVMVNATLAPFLQAIGERLHRGESVWVLPEVNGVDALFELRNVSPYPSHLPGWLDEEAQRRLIRTIEKNPPSVVIVFSRSVKEYGAGDFGIGYDQLLSEWIDRNYSVVESMPAGKILRPRAKPGGNL